MSRYDGLIIPRSYSEYINKTDAATLLQALQLSGVMDNAPTANSNHPVKSGGTLNTINAKIAEYIKSEYVQLRYTHNTNPTGFIVLDISTKITNNKVIGIIFNTTQIGSTNGLQLTPIYIGSGKLYLNYNETTAVSSDVNIDIYIKYFV